MIKINDIKRIITGSVVALLLWTFISVNTAVFWSGGAFKVFPYIISYILVLAVWAAIVTKLEINERLYRVLSIITMLAVPFLGMQISMTFAGNAEFMFGIYFANIAIYFIFLTLIFAVSKSMRISGIVSIVLIYLFNLVSFVLVILRGTPLIPSDFLAIGTAAEVAGNYEFEMRYNLIYATMIMIFTIALSCKFSFKITDVKKGRISRAVSACTAVLIMFSFGVNDYTNTEMDIFDQYHANNTHGVALSFYINMRRMKLEKPEDYDPVRVETVLTEKTDNKEGPYELPNIIVVMNESFSDLSVIGDFETDREYLPFWNSINKNVKRGTLLVSPFGGYTCNTEFEVLTGMSMGMLPAGSAPYLQYISREYPFSMPNYMKSLGYKSIAVHPYYARCWNRTKVYGCLGFDKFISMDNMGDYQDANEFEYIRNYMSDRTSYSAVMNQFLTKAPDERLFVFNITMQNHGGYTYSGADFEKTVSITNMEGSYPETEQYLSLIKESDKAFEELIYWFKQWDEPTIIVMFGDHQPGIEQEFYEELYDKPLDMVSGEELQKRYKVPFLIWANYDIEEEDGILTSPNYLSNYIIETANLPKGNVNLFLDKVQDDIPAINAMGHYDKDGKWTSNDVSKSKTLEEYSNIEYYMLAQKKKNLEK